MASSIALATPKSLAERHSRGELANLDFLRAVAVGLVFIGHLLATMRIRVWGDFARFGVLLFFVHTALVLMMSIERLGLSGRDLYKTFMLRRFFRIYPLSILSVLMVGCFRIPATSWLSGYHWEGWPAFVSNILLTQNLTQSSSINCVLWSLPFEIQMYAILPLLFLWSLRFPSLRAASAAWLFAVAIALSEYIARPGTFDFLLSRYFLCFLAGVFAWRLMKDRKPRFPGWAWAFLLIALLVGYRLFLLLRTYGPATLGALHGVLRNDHGDWWDWPPYCNLVCEWLFCAAVGLSIPYFLEIRSHWLKWISKQTARYSYGIYVSHVPVLWLCFVRLRTGSLALSAALAVILTAFVSVLAYHGLEDPAIRFGKRLTAAFVQRPSLALDRL